jgi:hypothetical protein
MRAPVAMSGRQRARCVSLAVLMFMGALLPALPAALGATLADNVPFLDSLDSGNQQDDHSFNVSTGTWAALGTLVYDQAGNTGDLRSELRQGSTAGAMIASDSAGDVDSTSRLSVLAVNGFGLGSGATFWASEVLLNDAPSYAVEFEGTPTVMFANPYIDSSSIGASGVLQAYQVFLNKRDTLDIRLAVPSTYTYNYNLQLFLFGGSSSNFYSAAGVGTSGPAAQSGGPDNSDQYLRYTAPVSGWFLLLIGNTRELANVPYTLTVYTNGKALADTQPDGGTVDSWNTNDDFAFANPASDWGFVALRNDNAGYGEWVTAEMHSPTFDSNVLASESPAAGSERAGVIAVNRNAPSSASNTSLITVKWGPYALFPVAYTLEMDNRVPLLASSETPVRMNFSAGEILRGGEIALSAGQTVEIHVGVDPLFTYPHELELIVFAPGSSYYSGSGTVGTGPVASARTGVNTAQDLTFTAKSTGYYGVAVLSLNSTYMVPVDVTVKIQGGLPLVHNDVRVGVLDDGNPQDLFAFTVDSGRWGVLAGRFLAGTGAYKQQITTGGFDGTPVASDTLGASAALPTFAFEAVNGYRQAPTNYYASVVRVQNAPIYMVEYDAAPLPLPRNARTNVSVPDGQIVSAYEVNLNAGETVDFRMRVDAGYSYPYNLQLFLLAPVFQVYSTSGALAPSAYGASAGTESTEQDLVGVVPFTGSYLVVLANLGNLTEVPATIDVRINGEPLSVGVSAVSDLSAANALNYYAFSAPPTTWTVAGVKIGSASKPADTLVHSLHGPTPDSNALATDRVRGIGAEGIIAIDGFAQSTNASYFLSEESALQGANTMTFQVQIATSFVGINTVSQVVSGSLPASSQFVGFQINLNAGQTLDLRLRRAEGYSYPYSLGLLVFRPGSGNASSSGEGGGAPMVSSANGPSVEQDGIFTATTTGVHLILVVNLDTPRDIAYGLNLTVDGWPIASDTHIAGDLNSYNRADQYNFQTAGGAWTAAGVKWTSGLGTVRAGLHTLGLNTVPLATVDANALNTVAVLPFFAPANSSNASTTFYFNITLAPQPGTPTANYEVGFAGSSAVWPNSEIGQTKAFNISGSSFFALHQLELVQGDHLEITLQVVPSYSKEHDLNLALYHIPLSPEILQVTAVARGGEGLGKQIIFQTNDTGSYLLVVENAGAMDTVPYTLSLERHTTPTSPPRPINVTSETHGQNFIDITWTMSQEANFADYEVYVSLTDQPPAVPTNTIKTREMTADRIEEVGAGGVIQPGRTYYVWVLVRNDEGQGTYSASISVTTTAHSIFEETNTWILVATLAGLGVIALFGYLRARGVKDGKGFRLRSSKAEQVVTEKAKGPPGKPRSPKGEEALAVPAAPPKAAQESVDYMQRVMKGGR